MPRARRPGPGSGSRCDRTAAHRRAATNPATPASSRRGPELRGGRFLELQRAGKRARLGVRHLLPTQPAQRAVAIPDLERAIAPGIVGHERRMQHGDAGAMRQPGELAPERRTRLDHEPLQACQALEVHERSALGCVARDACGRARRHEERDETQQHECPGQGGMRGPQRHRERRTEPEARVHDAFRGPHRVHAQERAGGEHEPREPGDDPGTALRESRAAPSTSSAAASTMPSRGPASMGRLTSARRVPATAHT